MAMTDPIADFLTRIRNANMVKHESVEVPASKMKKNIAEILKNEGFVRDVEYIEDDKQGIIRVFLKYRKNNALSLVSVVSQNQVYAHTLKLTKCLRFLTV